MKNLCFLNHSVSALFIKSAPVVVNFPRRGHYFSGHLPSPGQNCPLPGSALSSHPCPSPWNDSLATIYWHALSSQRRLGIAFKPLVLLTGQTGTFLCVHQLTARRALISPSFEEWQAVGGEACPTLPLALRTREVKKHLVHQCRQSSSPPWRERSPPLLCRAPIRSSSASPPAGANLGVFWC